MARKLSADIDARIATLHSKRRTEAQIAATLAREGVEVSVSGVHRVLGRLGLAAPRKGSKAAKRSKASPPPAPSAPAVAEESDDAEDIAPHVRLRRSLASLERAALLAEADGDPARIVAAQRAITAAAGLLAKVMPVPPVDVDARPDMVAAAQRGRERIRAIAARVLGGAK